MRTKEGDVALRSEWDERLGTMRPFGQAGDDYTYWSESKGHRSEAVNHHHSRIILRVESVIGEHRGVRNTRIVSDRDQRLGCNGGHHGGCFCLAKLG